MCNLPYWVKRHPSLFLRLGIGISRLLWRKPGPTSRMVEEASLFSSFFTLADSGNDFSFFILAVLICSCTSSSGLHVSLCGDSFPAECSPAVLLVFFTWLLLPTLPCTCVDQLSAVWNIQGSIKALSPPFLSQQAVTTYVLTPPPTPALGQLLVLIVPRISELFRDRKERRIQSCSLYSIVPRI